MHLDIKKDFAHISLFKNLLKLLKDKFGIDYKPEDLEKMETKGIEISVVDNGDLSDSLGIELISTSPSAGTAEMTPENPTQSLTSDDEEKL